MDAHWEHMVEVVRELELDERELSEGAFAKFVAAFKRVIFGKQQDQARKDKARDKADEKRSHRPWKSKAVVRRAIRPENARHAKKLKSRYSKHHKPTHAKRLGPTYAKMHIAKYKAKKWKSRSRR